jgi:hypothetical protein
MLGPPAKTATPTKNPQIPASISNRESLRLETDVTRTKQRPTTISNREVEPLFTTQSPPPRPISSPNSNRESPRLEADVTPTKQRPTTISNREVEPLFTGPATGLVSPGVAASRNGLQAEARHKGPKLGGPKGETENRKAKNLTPKGVSYIIEPRASFWLLRGGWSQLLVVGRGSRLLRS